MKTPLCLICVLLLPACATPSAPSTLQRSAPPSSQRPASALAADSVAIVALVAELDSAWAHADADRWVAPYAPDATFINILGMLLPDRAAVRERHDQIFRTVFSGSHYRSQLRALRFLGPDAAVADVDIEVTDFAALPPGSQPTQEGVLRTRMRHVLERADGRWWIVATQNTAVAPPF